MLNLTFAITLAVIMLLAIVLNKTYHHLPLKELRRQAREGQYPAKTLYRAAAYGSSLQALLFIVIVLTAAGSFVLFSVALTAWLAFSLTVLLLWLGFLWLPSSRLTSISSHMATLFAPPLSWMLRYVHPLLERVSGVIHDRYGINVHTGMYDKNDLLELLEWQKEQTDSRISLAELDFAERALTFEDKLARDALMPRRAVRTVGSSEIISPVLIDELHQTGYMSFPVYEGKKDHIIGTLYLQDLLVEAKSSKSIRSIMKRDVHYVHEEFSLYQVLQAFLKTNHHLFVVVNKFEEFVGIITIEDVLKQIVGKPTLDEFDRYGDLNAVAAAQAKVEPDEHEKTDVEAEDVVE
ncbi:MAG TPA: CBS domain-containing protein [Candidatus Saccharimonadales bacterium]|nr:CBS domain-containing protein [Candidatus Saccharimonadales bacterium]